MACAHANLCVQPEHGLMGLAPGGRVVLGLPGAVRGAGVPPEQAVAWHTLRPGSGRLAVTLCADGPTRLVRITDQANPDCKLLSSCEEDGESEEASLAPLGTREWGVRLTLGGLSVSLVARWPPAELLYAHFAAVRLDAARAHNTAHLALTVDSMQWDNQLPSTPSPVLLHCLPERSASSSSAGATLPALHVSLELQRAPPRNYNAVYFNHFVVALRPIAVRLDERLILLMWSWVESGAAGSAGSAGSAGAAAGEAEDAEEPDEAEFETRRVLHELTALHATRYYFALIKIIPSQIRLSMFTANKLEGELSTLKRRLGLTFIRFEDAAVELEPFVRAHSFDTAACLARQLLQHFKDELNGKGREDPGLGWISWATPLVFVSGRVGGACPACCWRQRGALLKNVTHGISNSAAISHRDTGRRLERVVGDEAHEETRAPHPLGRRGARTSLLASAASASGYWAA
nr:vacuolar protein sorting-associated protein 13D-like [Maniola hyperantus]